MKNEIIHTIPIQVPKSKIYQALVEQDELSKWWLPNAKIELKIGSIGTFPLSSGKGKIKMRILDLINDNCVQWQCVEHIHQEWIGTIVEFKIIENSKGCELKFKHSNWTNTDGVYGLVSYYWAALYLTKLKNLLEYK